MKNFLFLVFILLFSSASIAEKYEDKINKNGYGFNYDNRIHHTICNQKDSSKNKFRCLPIDNWCMQYAQVTPIVFEKDLCMRFYQNSKPVKSFNNRQTFKMDDYNIALPHYPHNYPQYCDAKKLELDKKYGGYYCKNELDVNNNKKIDCFETDMCQQYGEHCSLYARKKLDTYTETIQNQNFCLFYYKIVYLRQSMNNDEEFNKICDIELNCKGDLVYNYSDKNRRDNFNAVTPFVSDLKGLRDYNIKDFYTVKFDKENRQNYDATKIKNDINSAFYSSKISSRSSSISYRTNSPSLNDESSGGGGGSVPSSEQFCTQYIQYFSEHSNPKLYCLHSYYQYYFPNKPNPIKLPASPPKKIDRASIKEDCNDDYNCMVAWYDKNESDKPNPLKIKSDDKRNTLVSARSSGESLRSVEEVRDNRVYKSRFTSFSDVSKALLYDFNQIKIIKIINKFKNNFKFKNGSCPNLEMDIAFVSGQQEKNISTSFFCDFLKNQKGLIQGLFTVLYCFVSFKILFSA